jgi:hypothetical protein
LLQTLSDISGLQRLNQLTEIALHHSIQVVKREADAVIGHAVLRKIVGANFFFASAGTDLSPALRAVFLRFLALLVLQLPRAQNR